MREYNKRKTLWLERLMKFLKHLKEYNGYYPTNKNDPELYMWVIEQRRQYQKRKTPPGRLKKLKDINFAFNVEDAKRYPWDANSTKWWGYDKWLEKYISFKMFIEEHKRYPTFKDSQEPNNWYKNQRGAYKRGQMSESKINLLKKIDFDFAEYAYRKDKQMKCKIKLRGEADSRRYWLNGTELTPEKSLKVYKHSPDGFNHGYSGSGPAQLALAIMLELTDDQYYAIRHYQDVKSKYIASLPQGQNFERDIEIEI